LDALLRAFVEQRRMKITGGYGPCYEVGTWGEALLRPAQWACDRHPRATGISSSSPRTRGPSDFGAGVAKSSRLKPLLQKIAAPAAPAAPLFLIVIPAKAGIQRLSQRQPYPRHEPAA